jgi:phosphatidylserine/phosphatidylglycerophosphate/cardiolipin synthase-like enzyme
MEQAYFTGIKNQIISLIDEATNNLKIAVAWFTNDDLFASLIRSLNRGLKVELILLDDSINFMDYAPDFNQFIEIGGILRIAKSDVGFMHHKF